MKNIIINADDFGRSSEVNEAICECICEGYIDRTTLMMNMPGTEEAIKLAKKYGFMNKVGLHLNLCEGEPLLEETKKSFLCINGEYNSCIHKRRIPAWRIIFNRREKLAIKRETEAQIQKYIGYGFENKHIDSHRHTHYNLGVLYCIYPVLKKYRFESIRVRNSDVGGSFLERFLYKSVIKNLKIDSTEYFFSLRQWENFENKDVYKKSQVELSVHPYKNELGKIADSKGELFAKGYKKEKYGQELKVNY